MHGLAQPLERGRRMTLAGAVGGRGGRAIGVIQCPAETAVTAHRDSAPQAARQSPRPQRRELGSHRLRPGKELLAKVVLSYATRRARSRAPTYWLSRLCEEDAPGLEEPLLETREGPALNGNGQDKPRKGCRRANGGYR